MKKLFFIFLLLAHNVLFAEYVPGEVIVKMKKSSNLSSYARVSEIAGSDLKVMKIDKGKDVLDAVAELAQNPDVEYAQPNYIYHISAVPNDTQFAKQWSLKNTAQTVVWPSATLQPNNPGNVGDDINAEDAWDLINDCSSVTVAVIDTGIQHNHADLSSNMWVGTSPYINHGYDFVGGDYDPLDDNGHGTHVAGIIGAVGNNGVGIAGVCWHIKIMALKAFDACGSGSTSKIIAAIEFAINHGVKIINASFNLYGTADPALSAEVTSAAQAGILIVAAAGNGCASSPCSPTTTVGYDVDSGTKTYPCDFTQENILCVAAVDQKFQRASFSNYGATSVDVGAPGTNIVSTWPTGVPSAANCTACSLGAGCTINQDYYAESGTSMATPYTVGVAALVWAQNPAYTYLDVKHAVMSGGSAVTSMSAATVSGKVVNANGALNYINVPTGLTAVVSQ